MVDIKEAIVAVKPDTYFEIKTPASFEDLEELKKIMGSANSLSDAVNKATAKKLLNCKPLSSYKMTYDSSQNQLEPIYYWFLDFMNGLPGMKIEKITDNFMASPGSGQFSEMGAKATAMQQQATKILADTNTLIKTIQNLVYDLSEFEIRLAQYKKANSEEKKEKEEGMLALKNVWLDQVDLKRGRGSIHQMANEMGFTTLREAFLVSNSTEDVEKMAAKDGVINDSVKRILIPRLSEFLLWKDISERELTKRFEIEKSYLKSEVESLKMYTKWARPYLKAAEDLRMKGFDKDAALVSAFSTSMFELTMLGLMKADISKNTELKQKFGEYKLKKDFYSIYVVTFKYRGHLGQKAGQGGQSGYAFSFGGKVDMTFDSFALSSEELALVRKIISDTDLSDGLNIVENNMNVALDQLQKDIEKFTKDTKEEEKKKEESKEDDINPFSALFNADTFSFKEKKKEDKKIELPKDLSSDNFVEETVREEAKKTAMKFMYTIYDIYKKAHAMPSSPFEFDNGKES